MPDGSYAVQIKALNAYDGNTAAEVANFPFIIDRVSPKITELYEYVDEGRNMLSVSCYDENYLMSILMIDQDGNNTIQNFTPAEKGEMCQAVFDITDVESYDIHAMDYAYNTSSTEKLPQVSIHKTDSPETYTLTLSGRQDASLPEVCVIPSVYQSDGTLFCVGAPAKLQMPAKGEAAVTQNWTFLKSPPENATIRVFFWKDLASLTPLYTGPVANRLLPQ